MKSVVLVTVMGVMALAWVNSASADASYGSRFGTVSTNVGIGASNGRVFIVEQRVSDGSCQNQVISTTTALTQNITFNAGGGANRVRVAIGGWPVTLCGFTLTNLTRGNGAMLSIKGGAGDDVIIVEKQSSAQGGAGNDIILAFSTAAWSTNSGRLWGDDGNDWIIQTDGAGMHDMLIGGIGDDHLCDLGDGSEVYGGDGRDYFWNYSGVLQTAEVQMPSAEECQNVASVVYLTQSF
jgi:Ca2+-binding RTX toxin-like protein